MAKQEGEKKENPQIPILLRTTTITLRTRQFPQPHLPTPNHLPMPLQNLHRLFLRPRDLFLLPATRPSTVPVLHQQMRGADFLVGVVFRKVGFESWGDGAFGGLPARFAGSGVEEVREPFGLRVADFPVRWEAGFCVWSGAGRGGRGAGFGLEEGRELDADETHSRETYHRETRDEVLWG